MDLKLKDKVIAITGGGTGIGKAAAFAFAREGAIVYILGRRENTLNDCCTQCRAEGYSIHAIMADVVQEKDIKVAASQILQERGMIDVWVNNAGALLEKPLLTTSRDEYIKYFDANLYSVLLCTQVIAPHMIKRRQGVFLNASSFAAKIPNGGSGVYAMAKSAVSTLTKVLSYELAPHNIRVIGYMPGSIATEMVSVLEPQNEEKQLERTVMHRRGTSEEVGALLCFLASDISAYISGVDVEISGGKYAVQLPV